MCVERIPKRIHCDGVEISILEMKDAEGIYAAVSSSLEALREFPSTMPWALYEPSLEASQAFCRQAIASCGNGADVNYVLRLPGEKKAPVIGVVGLHHIDWHVAKFELGFWCAKAFQGKGYMTAAVLSIRDAFANSFEVKRIYAVCDARNNKAIALCSRVGMGYEGTAVNDRRCPVTGALVDVVTYSICF